MSRDWVSRELVLDVYRNRGQLKGLNLDLHIIFVHVPSPCEFFTEVTKQPPDVLVSVVRD